MQAPRKIRVGLVGAGRIADLQVLGWREHASGEVAAVYDADAAVRARRSAEWGARPYDSLEDLLADPAIDAVEIATPHDLHADHAIAAIAAGKHVSLQKPPTRTLAELDRVIAAARGANVRVRVLENFMWYPPHRLARTLVEAGEIGDVLSVRILTALGRPDRGWDVPAGAMAWRMDPARCGGGVVTFDHGYHCFQLGRLFVADPVEVVHAFINIVPTSDGGEIDVPALVTWRYTGAPRFGSWEVVPSFELEVRSRYYPSDERLELRGTRGVIWVSRCTGKLLDEPPVVLYRDGETRAFHTVETDWATSFRDATRDFIDAIIEQRDTPLTLVDARATLVFALAAQRSARERREVTLAELE